MQSFLDWWNWTDGQDHLHAFLLVMSVFYVLGTGFLLGYIWLVMLRRNRRHEWLAQVRSRAEDDVATWMASDLTTWELGNRFQAVLKEDKRVRPVLADVIYATSKLLRDESQPQLRDLFRRLLLDRFIKTRLQSRKWYEQAYAVRVICQLRINEFRSLIRPRMRNRRGVLRVEAITALVAMGDHSGLRQVEEATDYLSDWEQLLLLERFKSLDANELPPYEDWLESSRPDWVLFGIRLCRHYNRLDKIADMGPLLKSDDSRVQVAVLGAFEFLGDPDQVPVLLDYLPYATGNCLVRTLKLLTDLLPGTEARPILLEYADHADPLVRLTALEGLRELGLPATELHHLTESRADMALLSAH